MARDYATTIRGLLANAEDEALPEATRASYRAKAETLMREYRVAEEDALAVDPTSVAPIQHVIVIRSSKVGYGDLGSWYAMIFDTITRHTGVRYNLSYDADFTTLAATVVGYEGDVRYTEFLWTAAYLMFSTRVDPVWSDDRSDEENIFLLRNAGVERRKISDRAWGNGTDSAARSKVQRIYVREAARRGEDVRAAGLGFNTDTYRQAYADQFYTTLRYRLSAARDAADSVGGGLVLHGRSERVDEAFYGLFPSLRPSTDTRTSAPWVDPRTTCDKKACKEGRACRDHAYLIPRAWTQADQERAERKYHSASAQAGRASGRDAAEGVSITKGHTRAGRLDASGTSIEA